MSHPGKTLPPLPDDLAIGAATRRTHAPPDEELPPHPPDLAGHRRLGLFLTVVSLGGLLGFETVPQGWIRELSAFGRFRRLLRPGINCYWRLWTFFERPGRWIQTSELTREWPHQLVLTSDGVECRIAVMVCYRIVDPLLALYEVDHFHAAVNRMVQAVLRNACGKMRAQDIFASRDRMTASLRESLAADIQPWGMQVRLVEITQIEVERS